MVLGEHEDAGTQADALGAGGQEGQEVERVRQVAVLRERHPPRLAVRVAALVAHRHDDVLDGEQRLEPDLVGMLREGGHPRWVAGHTEAVRGQQPEGDHTRPSLRHQRVGSIPVMPQDTWRPMDSRSLAVRMPQNSNPY